MNINYNEEMKKIIKELNGNNKLLLHSCCGPCSTAVIERLKDYFDITVLYYNPNIEPYEEYLKRKPGALSGGQRQRLTIARAVVKKPDVLILDDSASALDFATDAALRKAIRGMNNSPTVFIVSQRAASLMYADLIIVLDDGQVAGMGTHDELLANCEVYKEIYESQFKKADSEGGVA